MRWRQWAILAVGMILGAKPLQAETLGDGWSWRRPIAFKQALSDAPGESTVWVEFYANGRQAPDGADIRVTTADRVVLSSKVMQVSRDSDQLRVAFATKGDGPYYVWWGNPKAEKPAKELEIKRGILLEVSHNSVAGLAALNAPPGPVLASFILPEISIGYNPFGEERQVVLHYTGAFKIERPVRIQMAFTVNDLAILTIDGKEIARETQRQLKPQVRTPISLDLAAGWHTLDIKQVNLNQPNVILALAWQRPGERAFAPVPGAIFAPIAKGMVGGLEKVAGNGAVTAVPEIIVEPVAEGFLPPALYGQRYSFEVMYPADLKPLILWDFGDGQTMADLKKVSHMYLGPGNYPITARLTAAGASADGERATVRLAVKNRLYEKFPRPMEDSVPTIRSVLKDYRPEKLPGEQALRGMLFFARTLDDDGQVAWGKAWLAGKDVVPPADSVIFEETYNLARLEIARKDFKGAAESFRLAAGKALGMETRANLMRHQVMTLCDYVDDADSAVKESQDWLKGINRSNQALVRIVQEALAYALIAKGDGKGAKDAVDAAASAAGAAPVPVARGNAPGGVAPDINNQRQIRQGVLTRNVESFLQSFQQTKDLKDLDAALTLLNQWELEFPDALWEGFTRTLRVKAAAAEGRNLVAARIALAHARANPDGFYAAELLYRAAENYQLGGDQQRAKTVFDLLASKYPESPYAHGAEK